jgi:hypothetical protein
MSSVMSFSATPVSETAPCWAPPCPGSTTIRRTASGKTERFTRRGTDRGTSTPGDRLTACARPTVDIKLTASGGSGTPSDTTGSGADR